MIYTVGGDEVHIYIDNKSGAPIYDQIKTQIKAQIMGGELSADEMLPSIRGLAKDLRISFITTKRAYDDLEAEGFLYTVPGKGCFVAARNTDLVREENLKKIEEHMEEISRLGAACRLTREELISMMEFILEDYQ
jgi:GntR family transcriptional regulator